MNAKSTLETCAVMITTHNRLSDLKQTCESLSALNPQPDEWLFTVDGCTDGTLEWLAEAFPAARIIVNTPGLGSVASRDRMLREASSDLVLSVDDDSYPCETDALAQLKRFHANAPSVAVSTFPQRSEEYPESLVQKQFDSLGYIGSFANSGACFVRTIYTSLPGFPEIFFHMYEEPDYALQCIEAGYKVFHTNCVTIRHHFSGVGRDERRTHQRHARKECWSAIMRCPFPWMPFVVLGKLLSQARYASRRGFSWLSREPQWWVQVVGGLRVVVRERKAVSWHSYRVWLGAMKNVSRGSV